MVICLFTACSDDDDKMPQGPVITYAGKLPSNVNGYIFTYDENGRCIQVKSGSYVLGEIDYDKVRGISKALNHRGTRKMSMAVLKEAARFISLIREGN